MKSNMEKELKTVLFCHTKICFTRPCILTFKLNSICFILQCIKASNKLKINATIRIPIMDNSISGSKDTLPYVH